MINVSISVSNYVSDCCVEVIICMVVFVILMYKENIFVKIIMYVFLDNGSDFIFINSFILIKL